MEQMTTPPDPTDEAAYLEAYRIEEWPRPSVAVDVAVLTVRDGYLHVVLVRRRQPPATGSWALPGGFVGLDEELDAAAARVLRTKAGLDGVYMTQLATFGGIGRDPRGRVISVAYLGLVPGEGLPSAAMSAAGAALARVEALPEGLALRLEVGGEPLALAFDHASILGAAVARLRREIWSAPHVLHLMPAEFTYRELLETFEAVLGERLDRNSFRRRVDELQAADPAWWSVDPVGRRRTGARARPAELYESRVMRNRSRLEAYRTNRADFAWPATFSGQHDPAVLADRSVGCLVAGALGDGLGGPVEGLDWSVVEARYPGGVNDLPPWGARWSDDTQLTVVVAESLLETGGRFAAGAYVPRLVAWLPTGRGVGAATRRAIGMLGGGVPWEEVGLRIDSSGNGAAMRTAPVGLVHALDPSPAKLRSEAILFALPTHAGSVGVAATVAMAAGVGALARAAAAGRRSLDAAELIDFLVEAVADLEPEPVPERRPPGELVFFRDRLRQIPGWLRRPPRAVFEETWTGAFALESVPAAIYAFLRSPDDPREVLVTAANASHDTDTIASMAGNLVGAWLGAERLAADLGDWLDRLEGRERLEDLGRRLAALASKRR